LLDEIVHHQQWKSILNRRPWQSYNHQTQSESLRLQGRQPTPLSFGDLDAAHQVSPARSGQRGCIGRVATGGLPTRRGMLIDAGIIQSAQSSTKAGKDNPDQVIMTIKRQFSDRFTEVSNYYWT
jgi:hypothetical protein